MHQCNIWFAVAYFLDLWTFQVNQVIIFHVIEILCFLEISSQPEGNSNRISKSKDKAAGIDISSLDKKHETQTKVSGTTKERKKKVGKRK